jgi:hypothetical protein
VRQWARRGSRPRQPADQRYESAYLFGAICPARGTGAALAMPYADSEAMQLHLVEVSSRVRRGAHAVLLLDRAGWHTTGRLVVPKNITLVFLPSRAPELNPVENIWQYLRQNWLSNRVFETYEAIIEAACDAWRSLLAEPTTITSIGHRGWAHTSARNEGRWYDGRFRAESSRSVSTSHEADPGPSRSGTKGRHPIRLRRASSLPGSGLVPLGTFTKPRSY